jgi:rubrerythrin
MAAQVKAENARRLFDQLSGIEVKHQDRIFNEYRRITGSAPTRSEFVQKVVASGMEGGLTTQDYLRLYQPDLEVPEEVVSLAMAIEAQALDLYQRAAERAGTMERKNVLMQIADEERAHLEQLGALFEKR